MSEKKIAAPKAETAEETVRTTGDPNEELVEYMAPLLGMDSPRDVLCAVNGETIRIQRGVTVQIKRKFVKALQNAAEQEREVWKTVNAAQRAAEKPLAEM